MYWTAVFVTLVAGVVLVYVADFLLSRKNDAKEPKVVPHRIPLIGHALGLLGSGSEYYNVVGRLQKESMYTLQILSTKLYVTNSSELVAAVQRTAKTLSFTPFQKFASERYGMVSKMVLDLYGGDQEGGGPFVKEMDKAIHKSLMPGPDLDNMNLHTAAELEKALAERASSPKESFGLYTWIRHSLTVASTTGVYGPLNPYRPEDIEQDFWAWEKDQFLMVAGVMPSILAPRAYQAVQNLTAAFEKYFAQDGHLQGSALIRARHEVYDKYKISSNDRSRLEWNLAIALLPNTVPTCFWTLYEILQRPALLEDIREEVAGAVKRDGSAKFTLDVAAIKSKCRLLHSTMQETQRTRSRHASIRKVVADTVLDKNYLLKKGNYVQLPTRHIHMDPKFWGSNAANFQPARFAMANNAKMPSNGLLAWGFSPHLCPARQFATTEIMILVAMLVMRYDIVPVGDDGFEHLEELTTLTTVYPPRDDPQVKFKPRKGWQGKWTVDVGESMSRFQLASG